MEPSKLIRTEQAEYELGKTPAPEPVTLVITEGMTVGELIRSLKDYALGSVIENVTLRHSRTFRLKAGEEYLTHEQWERASTTGKMDTKDIIAERDKHATEKS